MYNVKKILRPLLFLVDSIGYILFSPFVVYNRLFKRQDRKEFNEILVIRLDHLGDMVMTSPVFSNIKKNLPGSNVTVLCRSLTYPLVKDNKDVDNVIVLDPPWFSRGESTSWRGLLKLCLQNFRRYDLVLELHTDPRHNILAFLMGKNRVGYGSRGLGFLLTRALWWDTEKRHMVDRYLEIIGAVGLKVVDRSLSVQIDDKDQEYVSSLLPKTRKPIVGVHPITGRENKNWHKRKWIELTSMLVRDHTVVFMGSSQDKGYIRSITSQFNKGVHDLSGRVNIRQYFALVSLCDYIVSPDTLTVHVASALDKRLVALFGPTPKEVWGPRSENSIVIQGHFKGCSGLELPECKYKKGSGKCMGCITVRQVVDALKSF